MQHELVQASSWFTWFLYAQVARDFRKSVLAAIRESARRDTTPPFVPVALYDHEPIHDPICQVRLGSYWNIIIGYTIASGVFPPGSEEESCIPRYLEQHSKCRSTSRPHTRSCAFAFRKAGT